MVTQHPTMDKREVPVGQCRFARSFALMSPEIEPIPVRVQLRETSVQMRLGKLLAGVSRCGYYAFDWRTMEERMRFSVPCVFVMASLICCCAIQGCGDDGVGGEVCGNGYCGSGENVSNCPGDCGGEGIVCGNGKCEAGENVSNCPADCGGSEADCGNGDCEAGESSSNCPSPTAPRSTT